MWMGFYRIGDSALQVFMTGLVPHVIAIAVWRVMERKVVLFPWKLGVNPEEFSEEDPVRSLQLALVPRQHPGIHSHEGWNVLGQRATDSGHLFDSYGTNGEHPLGPSPRNGC